MKVLITGGAGFIGSHTVERLLRENCSLTILDNLTSGTRENVPPSAAFVQMDIRSSEIAEFFQRQHFDCVIHLAAQTMVPRSLTDPYYDCDVNLAGLVNVLEACRHSGVRRVVFPSSAAVYGDADSLPITEEQADLARPASFYALSKKTAEQYLALYRQVFGLEYVVLRYANVYGERQGDFGEGGVISIFARKIRTGQPLVIFGDGGQTRDFIYAGDVAGANLQALLTQNANRVYNISTQAETSLNQLAEFLGNTAGTKAEKIYENVRKGDIYRSSLDNAAARGQLGWQPQVSLAEGLARTYQALV